MKLNRYTTGIKINWDFCKPRNLVFQESTEAEQPVVETPEKTPETPPAALPPLPFNYPVAGENTVKPEEGQQPPPPENLPNNPVLKPQIPDRPKDATGGQEFMQSLSGLTREQREQRIQEEILKGNIPDFLRQFKAVSYESTDRDGNKHSVLLTVMPDYLAVGSNDDNVRMPMSPLTAKIIADKYQCMLPTAKIVNEIHLNADTKIPMVVYGDVAARLGIPFDPSQPPDGNNMMSSRFYEEQDKITKERLDHAGHQLGNIVSGIKKELIITNNLLNNPDRLAFHGGMRHDGKFYQNKDMAHENTYVDYSHGARLISRTVYIDGKPMDLAKVLQDPNLYKLVNDDSAPMKDALAFFRKKGASPEPEIYEQEGGQPNAPTAVATTKPSTETGVTTSPTTQPTEAANVPPPASDSLFAVTGETGPSAPASSTAAPSSAPAAAAPGAFAAPPRETAAPATAPSQPTSGGLFDLTESGQQESAPSVNSGGGYNAPRPSVPRETGGETGGGTVSYQPGPSSGAESGTPQPSGTPPPSEISPQPSPEKREAEPGLINGSVLFMGDSISVDIGKNKNLKVTEGDEKLSVAEGSRTTEWLLRWLNGDVQEIKYYRGGRVAYTRPCPSTEIIKKMSHVVVLIGTNDIGSSHGGEHILNNIRKIYSRIQEINPTATIHAVTIPPFKGHKLYDAHFMQINGKRVYINNSLKEMSENSGGKIKLIDICKKFNKENPALGGLATSDDDYGASLDPDARNPGDAVHPRQSILSQIYQYHLQASSGAKGKEEGGGGKESPSAGQEEVPGTTPSIEYSGGYDLGGGSLVITDLNNIPRFSGIDPAEGKGRVGDADHPAVLIPQGWRRVRKGELDNAAVKFVNKDLRMRDWRHVPINTKVLFEVNGQKYVAINEWHQSPADSNYSNFEKNTHHGWAILVPESDPYSGTGGRSVARHSAPKSADQSSGGEKVQYTAEKGAAASSALSQFIAEGARYGDTKVVNVDGQDYLAKFEEHTIFGADPSKTPRPHPSVGLYPVKGSPPPANTEGTDSAVA